MSRIVVRAVRPAGLHGFRAGDLLIEGLDEGLNVFYAPNATGKSTLARAIGLLFSPTQCDPDATIVGEIEGPEGLRSRVVRRKDGAYDGFPGRPEAYLLDLVRLLEGFRDKDDQSVLRRIVASNLVLEAGSGSTVRRPEAVRHAAAALDALRATRAEKGRAVEAEDRLEALRRDAEEAERAASRLTALDAERVRRDAVAERTAIQTELAEMDDARPGLVRQKAGAVATARALHDALTGATTKREEAERSLRAVRPDGRRPERPPTEAERRALATAWEAVAAAVGRRNALASARSAAQARARSERDALFALAPEADPDDLPLPTSDDLLALRAAVAQDDARRTATVEGEAYEAARRRWSERHPDDEADPGPLVEAARDWLAAEPPTPPDRRWATVGVAALALVATALVGGLVPRLVLAVAGIVGVGGLLLAATPTQSRRREIAARFPRLTDVATAAEALRDALARKARREIATDLAAGTGRAAPEGTWRQTAVDLRLRTADPVSLVPVASAMKEYLEARRTAVEADTGLAEAERALAEGRRSLVRLFEVHAFPVDPAHPEAAIPAFERWFACDEALTRAEGEESVGAARLEVHLESNGVPSDADRLEELARREADAERRRELVARLGRIATKVPDPELGDLSDDEVAERHDAERRRAERAFDLRQEIGAAEQQVRAAESERKLPAAEAEYARRYAAVEAKWAETARKMVRTRLHAALADRLRREDLPPIVRAANARLASFSRGRYRLELGVAEGDGLGALIVRDLHRGRAQGFSELSTGTKVHAIVALRMGLIDEHERTANGGTLRFPLVADEAMAVSDPEASDAIADALIEIARERQVIVFTNQPDDLARLGVVARSLGSDPPEARPTPEPPAYRAPQGPSSFDPTLPVGAHAVAAVLPFASEAATVAEWLRESPVHTPLVEGLDRLRDELAREYPRLTWAAIERAAWVTSTYRERARDLVRECGGSGRRFLRGYVASAGMRTTTKTDAEAWLEDNGFLREPPSEETLRRAARSCLGREADPFQVEHAVGLFARALR